MVAQDCDHESPVQEEKASNTNSRRIFFDFMPHSLGTLGLALGRRGLSSASVSAFLGSCLLFLLILRAGSYKDF